MYSDSGLVFYRADQIENVFAEITEQILEELVDTRWLPFPLPGPRPFPRPIR